jgi:hypothetical protein
MLYPPVDSQSFVSYDLEGSGGVFALTARVIFADPWRSYPTIMPKTSGKTSENPDFCPIFEVFFAKSQEFGHFSQV